MDVSVVVPTYNRRPVLQRTVRYLLEQEFTEGRYEVVVVDDQSTDDTCEWLEEARTQHEQLVVVRNPSKGRGQARNAGIGAATGQIICFVDDDVWVAPGFVAAHWRAHQRHGPKAVIVGKLSACPETARTIANQHDDARLVRVEQRIEAAGENLHAGYFRTGNVSVSSDFVREIGGFDESFKGYSYEDSELGYRLMANGAVFRYAPDAAGVHYTDTTIADLLRKKAEAGRSAVTFLRRWPEAADRVSAPFVVPGVPTTDRRDGLAKRSVKALALFPLSEVLMRGLLAAAVGVRHRGASCFLLDCLGWVEYAKAFRRAAKDSRSTD